MGKTTLAEAYSPSEPSRGNNFSKKMSWIRDAVSPRKTSRSNSWSSDSSKDGSSKQTSSTRTVSRITSPRCSITSLSELVYGSRCNTCELEHLTEQEEQLMAVLEESLENNEDFCMDVVAALLGNHVNQGHLKVRFAVAIIDLECNMNSKARRFKAGKIVGVFLRPDSSFRIESLPSANSSSVSHLSCYKKMVLTDLIRETCVRDLLPTLNN